MFQKPVIAPSILSADFMNMGDDVALIEQGGAGFVHIDVMDGHFVPNLTLGVPFVKAISKITKLPLDVHLMISNPLEQLPWFLACAPDVVTVHAEALDNDTDLMMQAIDLMHRAHSKACIALKPDTPIDVLDGVIAHLDMVLIMSVYPGFSGQSYIEGSDARVAEVVKLAQRHGVSPLIEVDGGLANNEPTKRVVAAGADVLVAGSGIFAQPDKIAALHTMQMHAHEIHEHIHHEK
ncbi:MAG: ribulose-phosphate 3-epimerase [Eggerthellaceae bacterium]|nr:ribulose-phosphate 3-epimerase [Eggerthellaceae bacterium]